uniref:RRM domain-containing protein n=1 Tax=Sinocyclocheilus grahami TaxID=75366 RepID=A0A672K9R4_SINGR
MPRVYIGRLSYNVREKDIQRFFGGYGKLLEVDLKNGWVHSSARDTIVERGTRKVTLESARSAAAITPIRDANLSLGFSCDLQASVHSEQYSAVRVFFWLFVEAGDCCRARGWCSPRLRLKRLHFLSALETSRGWRGAEQAR